MQSITLLFYLLELIHFFLLKVLHQDIFHIKKQKIK